MATLYLICGMAGSGKTTLAKQLELTCHAIRLCPDEWIKQLIKNEHDKDELDRLRDPVEKLQWSIGQNLLHLETNVILENGFWSKEERLSYNTTAKEIGANVELRYLDVSEAELWHRIEKRNLDPKNDSFLITRDELKEWISWFTPPDETEFTMYDSYVVHKL